MIHFLLFIIIIIISLMLILLLYRFDTHNVMHVKESDACLQVTEGEKRNVLILQRYKVKDPAMCKQLN